MARQQDPTPRAARLTALGTVAILAMVAAFAFGRVFQGRAPTLRLMAAALASVALAAAFERRSLLLSTLVSTAGLLWAIGIIVFPRSLWYGLPSGETLKAMAHALRLVGEQAKVQVAPTPPLPPLLLAALTALWTASFSAHALAVRAGSPLLAILPPIALVGFADTVLEDGVRPIYAVAFLGAALAVVFIDGLRRIRQWGPMWSGSRSHRVMSNMNRGARGVALLAVAAAVVVPGLLPGFRAQALVDFSSSGDDVHFDPFVSIKAQLERRDPVDLFQVTAEGGASYWRLYALDQFNGTTWSSSNPTLANAPSILTPAQLNTQFPFDATVLTQRYRILRDLPDPWLPMASSPESVTLPLGGVKWDADLSTAAVPGGLEAGYEYSVTSRIVAPTPEQLDAVRFLSAANYGRFTFVPGDVSPAVKDLAERWSADAASPYRKVLALQDHFRDGGEFHYSLNVEPTADADALLQFLTRTKIGFCQQFATAMAIMVRELGIPARVVVGFQPGELKGATYTVATDDAHSWVEVLFPGYGWLPFEPTPGRANPIAQPGTYLNPSAPVDSSAGGAQGQEGAGGGTGTATCLGANGRPLPGQLCNSDPLLTPGRGDRSGRGGVGSIGDLPTADIGGYHIPYLKSFLVLLGLGLLLASVLPIVKSGRRRRALRRARGPRERVLATYRVFDGGAADLGLGRREGETPGEYRDRLSESVHFSDGHLAALTSAAIRAAYSPVEPDAGEASEAASAAKTAIRDMRRDAGIVRRIAGIYRPGW